MSAPFLAFLHGSDAILGSGSPLLHLSILDDWPGPVMCEVDSASTVSSPSSSPYANTTMLILLQNKVLPAASRPPMPAGHHRGGASESLGADGCACWGWGRQVPCLVVNFRHKVEQMEHAIAGYCLSPYPSFHRAIQTRFNC